MDWQFTEEKTQLSAVVAKAAEEGPQFITRHGEPVAVVLSPEEYERLTGEYSFKKYLRSMPDVDIGFERDGSPARDIPLCSDAAFSKSFIN